MLWVWDNVEPVDGFPAGTPAVLSAAVDNYYYAAQLRYNVAIALADALLYAQAALRNYATYGDRAAAEIQETQGLIEWIEQKMQGA